MIVGRLFERSGRVRRSTVGLAAGKRCVAAVGALFVVATIAIAMLLIPLPALAKVPLVGVETVATGSTHTCIVASGGVQCWGANSKGQLGDGTTASSSIPVQAIPTDSGSIAVAAGSAHTCAVVNGGVQCWGENTYRQLRKRNDRQ
ncbi:MAG: hypothetical protein IPI73_18860 [Betaproteobacteria bacterium]|nr:hypothetical protein [Betaproteobacteria bacterium]